jgi:hypothetical protein
LPSRSGLASPASPHLSEVESPTFGKVALCLRERNIAQGGKVGGALRSKPETPRPARARPGCPWMRPLVLLSVRELCRQVELRSVIGAGEETIEQLE